MMRLRCLSCGAQGDFDGGKRAAGSWFRLTCQCCGQVNRFQTPGSADAWRLQRGNLPLRQDANEPWMGVAVDAPPAPERQRPAWAQGLDAFERFAILDGSNLAFLHLEKGHPTLLPIEAAIGKLTAHGYEHHVWVDASLWHHLRDPSLRKKLDEYLDTPSWSQAPKGVEADRPILEEAEERRGIIVSGDAFRDYETQYPWLVTDPRRILRAYMTSSLDLRFAPSRQAASQAARKEKARDAMGRAELDRMLLTAFQGSKQPHEEFALRVAMAQSLSALYPQLRIEAFGFERFTDFLMAQDHLFMFEPVMRDGESQPFQIRVRLRTE